MKITKLISKHLFKIKKISGEFNLAMMPPKVFPQVDFQHFQCCFSLYFISLDPESESGFGTQIRIHEPK